MERYTKNLISISLIVGISLLFILGLIKIVQAPLSQSLSILKSKIFHTENKYSDPLPVQKDSPIEFIFGGDVMLSREVNNRIVKAGDYSWPFAKISDFLKNADLTIINLESPFILSEDYTVANKSFVFKASPQSILGLINSGIDLVSLANNHILNQGPKGLEDTLWILGNSGIKYIGAGRNEEEAHHGEIQNIKGQNFGFLAYAYPNDNSVAKITRPGIANMDLEKMKSDIKRLKEQNAIVIVFMHAGKEYSSQPNEHQILFAHSAIEAGAEAVIGHHPHWPQTFEFYNGKPIIYSLGNLIFDQMWSTETRQGLLAKMSWKNGWQKIELIPIKIYDYGQAEILADGKEKKAILNKIGASDDGLIKSE